ncbi:hypothetical protein ACIQTW_21510 [Paenarthrobacter sp. NPDC090517]|uniref:hypothetical protein n=1 Tax=Paenarthrobacter sp. NPDC090517 TaxID=3364381 RepID=UPI0037F139D4
MFTPSGQRYMVPAPIMRHIILQLDVQASPIVLAICAHMETLASRILNYNSVDVQSGRLAAFGAA